MMHKMLRAAMVALLTLFVAQTASAVTLMSGFENSIDRPGKDIKAGFVVSSPQECRKICKNNPNCKAWTYVRAGYQGNKPKCWIKHSKPAKKANNCCVSGTKIKLPNYEQNVDRPGSDIKPGFVVTSPQACRQACKNNPNCKAFTYVRAGYQGNKPKCWIKNRRATKVKNKHCCISGVVR